VVAAILNVLLEKTLPEENKRDGVLRIEVDGYEKMLLLSCTSSPRLNEDMGKSKSGAKGRNSLSKGTNSPIGSR